MNPKTDGRNPWGESSAAFIWDFDVRKLRDMQIHARSGPATGDFELSQGGKLMAKGLGRIPFRMAFHSKSHRHRMRYGEA